MYDATHTARRRIHALRDSGCAGGQLTSRYCWAQWMLAVCLGWLLAPHAALAWSLPVSPNPVPGIGEPIGMWYFHPMVHFETTEAPHDFQVTPSDADKFMQFGFAFVGNVDGILQQEGSYDGYAILTTNHYKNNGLGFILEYRTWYKGMTNDWTPVTTLDTLYPATWLGLDADDLHKLNTLGQTITVALDVDVMIHWIRLANLNTSGNAISINSGLNRTRFLNVRLATRQGGGAPTFSNNLVLKQRWQSMHTYRAPQLSCTTPAVTSVDFGTQVKTDFTHITKTLAERTFTLTFQNCPEGYNRIGYYFDPSTTGLESGHAGVIKLDGSSNATGFGIQILDESDLPVQFNQPNTYWLSDYIYRGKDCLINNDPCIGNKRVWLRQSQPVHDYSVDLKARLYQTDDTVTSGDFTSSLIVIMQYQ